MIALETRAFADGTEQAYTEYKFYISPASVTVSSISIPRGTLKVPYGASYEITMDFILGSYGLVFHGDFYNQDNYASNFFKEYNSTDFEESETRNSLV